MTASSYHPGQQKARARTLDAVPVTTYGSPASARHLGHRIGGGFAGTFATKHNRNLRKSELATSDRRGERSANVVGSKPAQIRPRISDFLTTNCLNHQPLGFFSRSESRFFPDSPKTRARPNADLSSLVVAEVSKTPFLASGRMAFFFASLYISRRNKQMLSF